MLGIQIFQILDLRHYDIQLTTNIVINITNVILTYTHKATKQKQTITSNYITN